MVNIIGVIVSEALVTDNNIKAVTVVILHLYFMKTTQNLRYGNLNL